MPLPKRPKKLDLSGLAATYGEAVTVGPGAVGAHRTPQKLAVSYEPQLLSLREEWEAMGDDAWKVLERRRVGEIFPNSDERCEFQEYLDLLRRSSPRYRSEIFVGVDPDSHRPIFVPRSVFEGHAYILGGTGSGKTSQALAQLLIQLSEGYTDADDRTHEPPPVVIFDMKPQGGDPFLRGLAARIAAERGQELRCFSNDMDYRSLMFSPWKALSVLRDKKAFAQMLVKALSLIHAESQESVFFMNEQRTVLEEQLLDPRNAPQTMEQLIDRLENATRGRGGNSEARGVHGALSVLKNAAHVVLGPESSHQGEFIDFDRLLERREVLYVHLDSDRLEPLSAALGKLMLFGLLASAGERYKNGRAQEVYVAIDEFHRLAAHNVVSMLEVARGPGIRFILSHQSPSSLRSKHDDLYGLLFENTSFKQCLTLKNDRLIELFRLIAGRVAERRAAGSTAASRGHSRSEGAFSGWSEGTTDRGWSVGKSGGTNASVSESESVTETAGFQEEMSTALTDEMIVRVNDTKLLSLVQVSGAGGHCLTPLGGVPRLVQGLFPFTKTVKDRMERGPWRRTPDQISPPAERVAPQPERGTPVYKEKLRAALARPTTVAGSTLATMRESLEQLADKLKPGMVQEQITVERFARKHRLSTREILRLAELLGLSLGGKQAPLTPEQATTLERHLGSMSRPETA